MVFPRRPADPIIAASATHPSACEPSALSSRTHRPSEPLAVSTQAHRPSESIHQDVRCGQSPGCTGCPSQCLFAPSASGQFPQPAKDPQAVGIPPNPMLGRLGPARQSCQPVGPGSREAWVPANLGAVPSIAPHRRPLPQPDPGSVKRPPPHHRVRSGRSDPGPRLRHRGFDHWPTKWLRWERGKRDVALCVWLEEPTRIGVGPSERGGQCLKYGALPCSHGTFLHVMNCPPRFIIYHGTIPMPTK
jgi:hypothetical protein